MQLGHAATQWQAQTQSICFYGIKHDLLVVDYHCSRMEHVRVEMFVKRAQFVST